jgi:hypothetical protein
MKLLAIIFSFVILSGCSAMATFDNVEYNHVNDIVTLADLNESKCAEPTGPKNAAQALNNKMTYLSNYVRFSQYNEYKVNAVNKLQVMVNEFVIRTTTEPVSETYCKTKLQLIAITAAGLQRTLGQAE